MHLYLDCLCVRVSLGHCLCDLVQGLGLHDQALRYIHASGVLAHDEAPCVARAEKLLARVQEKVRTAHDAFLPLPVSSVYKASHCFGRAAHGLGGTSFIGRVAICCILFLPLCLVCQLDAAREGPAAEDTHRPPDSDDGSGEGSSSSSSDVADQGDEVEGGGGIAGGCG